MVALLYKWLMFALVMHGKGINPFETGHPIFVSVVEIEHNNKDKTLELTCKLFTDDFEKTLRKHYNGRIDLLDATLKPVMQKLVNEYIQQHLKITVNGKPCIMQLLGFEQQEEGIVSYFQITQIGTVKQVAVFNNLLYEYSAQQMGIIHCIVNGQRKSSKLNNPETEVRWEW